ncbi:GNAT family N-acetyltransferase [Actinophytocola sp.]|uniref:GNAT family N-acetyltransferase n=1 Tax=Actinophytocola sp. TaxID=1872138 RepID=UPI00389B3461
MLSLRLAGDAELRALEPWQAEELAEHVAAAQEFLDPWLPWVDSVATPDGAARLLQRYADAQARGEGRIFGIWVDGKLSGGVLFRVWDAATGVCEVGVWLAPEVTGQGLVTRAVTHMIDWAFHVRGMHRVEWRCASTNEPSRRTAQRLGMTLDGTLREASQHKGKRYDVEVWSVLAAEWPTKR